MSSQSVALPNFFVACTRKVAIVILPTLLWTLVIDDNGIIAGILQQIQGDLQIGDVKASFIQITYIISYVFFGLFLVRLPNHRFLLRRCIMAITVIIWIISVAFSINVKSFLSFLLIRIVAGLGEATYSTIALTIIGLHYFENTPTKYLFPFYITISLSSGLSLAVSSKVANYMGSWQSGYQVTVICWVIIKTTLLFFVKFLQKKFVQNPSLDEREAEGTSHTLSLWENIKQITKKKSVLMMIVLHFFAGPLNYWGPKLISLGLANQKNDQSILMDNVLFVLGMVVTIATVVGALPHYFIFTCPSPSVSLMSMFLSALFAIIAVILSGINTTWCLVIFFLCFAFISFTAACVAKQMCTDFQTTKLTKKAYFFFTLLGKVVSNLLIGLISEFSQGDHFLLSNVSALNNWSLDTTNSTMINDAMFNFTTVISSTNTFGDTSNFLQLAVLIIPFTALVIILVFFVIVHIFQRDSSTQENIELGAAVANHRQSIIELFCAGVRHYWAFKIRPNAGPNPSE